MSVYTQAMLCWGIKIDEELVDERLRMDDLCEHVNQRKREEHLAQSWKNISNPSADEDLED